jgi:hypothetical protein
VSVCVFILVGRIEHFVVLEGLETMADRQKVDNEVKRQLQESEAYIRRLKAKLVELSTQAGADVSSCLPVNDRTTLGYSCSSATCVYKLSGGECPLCVLNRTSINRSPMLIVVVCNT